MRILRIVLTVLLAKRKSRLEMQEAFSLSMKVWPHEVDRNFANQSLYTFYMELARWEFIFRTGLDQVMKRLKCLPVVSAQSVRILKPLRRFQKIRVETHFSYWDEKWVYIDHKIYSGDQLVALGLIKGLFRKKDGLVSTSEIAQCLGAEITPDPRGKPLAQAYDSFEDELFKKLKKT